MSACLKSVCVCLFVPGIAIAQCATEWQSGLGHSGTDGPVLATTLWDPDGAGPLPEVLVLAGSFAVAGDVQAPGIATYDPATGNWLALGVGTTNGAIRALAESSAGELIAAGSFTTIGGGNGNHIARWSGGTWQPLGQGVDGAVYALLGLPTGDLVVGGEFSSAGGIATSGLAKWDGAAWSSLGGGMNGPTPFVYALAQMPNGDIFVGGSFTGAGGGLAFRLARWNGTSWAVSGSVGSSGQPTVRALAVSPTGTLVVGGGFSSVASAAGALSVANLAEWNGTSWSILGGATTSAFGDFIHALRFLPNGDLVAAGVFSQIAGTNANNIARFDGAAWSALGAGPEDFLAVVTLTSLPGGLLVAGGSHLQQTQGISSWDGSQWRQLGAGIDRWVTAVLQRANGELWIAGPSAVGGVAVHAIARRGGGVWADQGGNAFAPGARITRMLEMPNGDVVVAGDFTANGTHGLARWNGVSWQAVGGGLSTGNQFEVVVSDALLLPNGDLVVAGIFAFAGGVPALQVARWDGVAWSALGAGIGEQTHVMARMANGDLAVVVDSPAGLLVRRWDGVSWSQLGAPFANGSYVLALGTDANGTLIAAGSFDPSGTFHSLEQWTGTGWIALPGPDLPVQAIATLPGGDLVAGLADGVAPFQQNLVVRRSGGSWFAAGPLLTGAGPSSVAALQLTAAGTLVVGGSFTTAGSAVSANLAELASTCPASATAFGSGCAGSGGPNVLAARTLPWLGESFRVEATGMPAIGLALDVLGLNPMATALSAILPQGQPGCTLLVSPDLLLLAVPAGGVATSTLSVPPNAALLGAVLRRQFVSLELGAGGNLLALTSTNSLIATIGVF